MEEERGRKFALTPYPTPFSCCFSGSHLFPPSPQSECLEQATFSEAGLVRQGILLPAKWTWYFNCDIVALKDSINLSCFIYSDSVFLTQTWHQKSLPMFWSIFLALFVLKCVFLFIFQPTHDPVCCICASEKLLILVSVLFILLFSLFLSTNWESLLPF